MAATINSYRLQAERRASLSRAFRTPMNLPAPPPVTVKPPLALPPWGYGSARVGLPPTIINGIRRVRPPRSQAAAVHAIKQTNSSCESRPVAGRSGGTVIGSVKWSNPAPHHCTTIAAEGMCINVAEPKNLAEPSDKAHELPANGAARNTTSTISPTRLTSDDTIEPASVVVGAPVTSSSMETWTTYEDNSTSPRVQSTVSSPHSLVTPDLASTVDTPLSMPSCWPPRPTVVAVPADRTLAAICTTTPTALSHCQSSSGSPLQSPTSTGPSACTVDERPAVRVTTSPPVSAGRSDDLKNYALSAAESSSSAGVTAKKSTSQHSDDGTAKLSPHHAASKASSDKSLPLTASKTNVKDDKSSLMVGLVKVKSRHTGLMIDCPILETVYQNDMVEPPTTTATLRKSSSHKVVLIKAVVPRWAWNGRGECTPRSSSRASGSSANTTDRASVAVGRTKSSLVSVDTQTSETLLTVAQLDAETQISVRRTSSDQQRNQRSPVCVADTHVPASPHHTLLPAPSPKRSTSLIKASPATPTKSKVRSGHAENRVASSPKTQCQSPLCVENTIPMVAPAAVPSAQQTDTGKSDEMETVDEHSTSIEGDSLMEDTMVALKLDLHFSSSGNTSDNESITQKKNGANRSSSSSSVEMEYDRKSSPSCQKQPTPVWPSDAAVDSTSNVSAANVDEPCYVDERGTIADAVAVSSPNQKRERASSVERATQSSPSQGRSPTTTTDNSGPTIESGIDDGSRHSKNRRRKHSASRSNAKENYPRPDRSPCPWRSTAPNEGEDQLESSSGQNFGSPDLCQYEQQQNLSLRQQQQTSAPKTQYASRSESSLSEHSQSTFFDCCDVAMEKMSSSSRVRYGSIPPTSDNRWNDEADYSETTHGSDMYASMPFDADIRYSSHPHIHHRANDKFRTTSAVQMESTTRQSRCSRYRPPPPVKCPGVKAKTAVPADCPRRYKRATSNEVKRSADRQRKSAERQPRRGEVAQNSLSTGSIHASAGPARPPSTKPVRHHSSSASRRPTSHSGTEPRRRSHETTKDRHVSPVAIGTCCSAVGDKQRRRAPLRTEQPSTTETLAPRRSNRPATTPESRPDRPASSSLGRRHPAEVIRASASASADSITQQPSNAECFTSVAQQSTEHRTRRLEAASSPTIYYQCRPSAVYCSPRSYKPFPPPISDRCPSADVDCSSPTVGAAGGISSEGESSVKYVLLRRTEDPDYSNQSLSAARCDNYLPPSNEAPRRKEHHPRASRRSADNADKSDCRQRRDSTRSKASSCDAGSRRIKLKETPAPAEAVYGSTRSAESGAGRPPWKHAWIKH